MRKIISLLLIAMVIGLMGCTQKTTTPESTTQETSQPAAQAIPDSISSEVDSIAADIASIDVEGTGSKIIPITADELETD